MRSATGWMTQPFIWPPVRADDLFERAGFLGGHEDSYRGFSEESELNRCFDFVTRDPMVKDVLSAADKLAIVRRYETEARRKLISWTDEESPSSAKSDFKGLRLKNGVLYADRAEPTLTLDEAAQEFGIDVADMQKLVDANYIVPRLTLRSTRGGPILIRKDFLRNFKRYVFRLGLRLLTSRDKEQLPKTKEEYAKAHDALSPSLDDLHAQARHGNTQREL